MDAVDQEADIDRKDRKPAKRSRKYQIKAEGQASFWNEATTIAELRCELSVSMEREFTVLQIQDKLAKLKTEWSMSKPSLPAPTGNVKKVALPQFYDVMLEYWGEKVGFQRESLMSTDDANDYDGGAMDPAEKSHVSVSRRPGDAIEAGLNAVKEGLMFLGTSMASVQPPAPIASSGTSLDDVVRALNAQVATMDRLLAHIAEKYPE
ncbi:hypothetical protein H257_10908 [Aphanomyces astaci]|uniref:Uncharacterized protein n=1 Tax=Aphanomyces astaci TaxID=112090 RepID=W4G723_APHAT|nr:hypothetical protein H257_10908 [Aphanomyces astaci]ETV74869.1 hypothetical protein H257_10908 [Aphanomyces astaci]|eukprot:XP_009835956.1 hypothetical protein H257_10908 [Aphanomyces astaci]